MKLHINKAVPSKFIGGRVFFKEAITTIIKIKPTKSEMAGTFGVPLAIIIVAIRALMKKNDIAKASRVVWLRYTRNSSL